MQKMKRLLIVSTLVLLTGNFLFAQNKDASIKDIRAKYADIRTHLKTYSKEVVEIMGESAEGGEATVYRDNGDLKLIEIKWFGETGKRQVEYYLSGGKLFFAFDQVFQYNRPIFWDAKMAEENGDTESFDPKKTTVEENRYYFEDEKLFMWLDNEKKKRDLTVKENLAEGEKLVTHCRETKGKLKLASSKN